MANKGDFERFKIWIFKNLFISLFPWKEPFSEKNYIMLFFSNISDQINEKNWESEMQKENQCLNKSKVQNKLIE